LDSDFLALTNTESDTGFSMAPKFCPNCGAAVDDRDAEECYQCGQNFSQPLDESEDLIENEDSNLYADEEELPEGFDSGPRRSHPQATIAHRATVGDVVGDMEVVADGRSQEKTFWNSILGKIIRWVAYIPIGSILLGLVEYLSALFLVWLFAGDMRMFVIVGILFGGIFMVWPLIMAYYGIVVLANTVICPVPRVGAIIFGTIYGLGSIGPVISIFTSDFAAATIVTLTLLKIVFLVTAFSGIAASYYAPAR
jgi:hypothetical protein